MSTVGRSATGTSPSRASARLAGDAIHAPVVPGTATNRVRYRAPRHADALELGLRAEREPVGERGVRQRLDVVGRHVGRGR